METFKNKKVVFGLGLVVLLILSVTVIVILVVGYFTNTPSKDISTENKTTGFLSASARQALIEAINDEYKAHALYEKTIAKLGSVRPFSMIIKAEEQHISSLKSLFDKYGIEIPVDDWAQKVTSNDTLKQACATGVEAEIANAKLYREKLLPMVSDYKDIELVFTNLMTASEENHLKAFERCE